MTQRNAQDDLAVDQLMSLAKKAAPKDNQSMSQLTKSMAKISRTSEETIKMIKTIDEIAFNTNLLALNAAVEATRAGSAVGHRQRGAPFVAASFATHHRDSNGYPQ